MKHLTAALVLSLFLVTAPTGSRALPGEVVQTVAAKADQRKAWQLKRLTCRPDCDENEEFWQFGDKGRVRGEGGRGVYVFVQIRKCGKGRWEDRLRETTTSRGVFDFHDYYKGSVKRKYKVKEYDPSYPSSVQFGFFIPGTDERKPFRVASSYCYG